MIPAQFARVIQWTTADGQLPSIVRAAMHADRRDTVAKFEDLWAAMTALRARPLYDLQRPREEDLFQQRVGDARRFALLHALLPSLTRPDEVVLATRMDLEATRAIIALLKNRNRPLTLEALAANLPAQGPEDIYSGAPLRYTLTAGDGFLLYSVGPNGIDDNGSTAPSDRRSDISSSADVVYWPPPTTAD